MKEEVKVLKDLLSKSNRVVIFTGAGISTESGIPDFRGPQGLWKTVSPIDFTEFISSEEKRRERWSRQFSGTSDVARAKPNSGHMAIAKLVAIGKVSHVITQNVDGLHQKSGIPDDRIIELHGNSNYAKCLECEKRFELLPLKTEFLAQGTLPTCDLCGGIVKTATISFGQSMPMHAMESADAAALACDLFIAIGSSLQVFPAASLPQVAKNAGAKLAIINNESTNLDVLCDLVIHAQIGPTLSAVI